MDAPGQRLAEVARRHPNVTLMVLLGSRATGRAHAFSDWDIGVLGKPTLDLGLIAADLMSALGTDAVDLVHLQAASAVLRRDAATDGRLVFERQPGTFENFQIEASTYWCDVESVVREAHADVLRAVGA